MEQAPRVIDVEYTGRVAIITLHNEKKLNALNPTQYYDLAQSLREVATHDEVYITVLIGKGRYFSAYVLQAMTKTASASRLDEHGADVSMARASPGDTSDPYAYWLRSFVALNLNVAQAFYSHPKVLVVGLNGPVVGLSAALIAHADFIYAAPHAFLLTPFSSLGLVAEGGASRALAARLGPARAGEALLMSRRISAAELAAAGFVNRVLDDGPAHDDDAFRRRVLHEVDDRLGPHLNGDSLLGIKALMRRPERDVMDVQNVHEVFAGLGRFVTGVPQEEFRKIASGEKRHKL